MERKIGEVFECNGVRLKVVEGEGCENCYFHNLVPFGNVCKCGEYMKIHGECGTIREDGKSVQFVKVEDIKTESMKEQETKSLPIPEGWEFAGYDNGEIKIRRVEPELPTDYEKALGAVKVSEIRSLLVPSGMYGAVSALCKLLIYRNAWWQKLGWKPDWKKHDDKYVVRINGGNIISSVFLNDNFILTFPTEEVRDKFAETFRDLIEEAKELL